MKPPKKHKIQSNYSSDISIVGISCHLKDYRVAYYLNKQLNFSFHRLSDLVLEAETTSKSKNKVMENLHENETSCSYSFFMHKNKEERRDYCLVANHHPNGRLIPAQRTTDYLMFISGLISENEIRVLLERISGLKQFLAAFRIETSQIKNPEILLTELELHLLESNR